MREKILVLDGNSSQCLPLVRAFYKKGYYVTLVCPTRFSSGYFSQYINKRLIWPGITENEEKFLQVFKDHIKKNKYKLVLGLSDASTRMLSYHKEEIEKFVKTVVPDYKYYSVAADKYLTMQFCMEENIPCPLTYEIDKANYNKLDFPVVVKPKIGVGAVGFNIIDNLQSLDEKLPKLRKEYGELLIQEYIPNQIQYTAEVFFDKHSEMKTCVISKKTRFFPVKGGTSSCNITVENHEISHIAENLLKKIGWVGPANLDFVLDPRDNTPKIIEINPRIGATVKIACLAGIDISEMLINLVTGRDIKCAKVYKKKIIMRNLCLDLLWFIFSSYEDKRTTQPGFFQFFGRNVFYQSMRTDDPGPFIGFILGYLVKYSNLNKLKKKLGFTN